MLTRVFLFLLTLVTGSGVGGCLFPDFPLVGPLLKWMLDDSGNVHITDVVHETYDAYRQRTKSGPGGFPLPPPGLDTRPVSENHTTPVATASPNPDAITIASFNIQVFGSAKAAKPEVMEALVWIIRQFDVVAIQEIRSQDDQLLPQFVSAINRHGSRYDFVIGPRVGRTTSTEQYAFLFNTDRIEANRAAVYTAGDRADLLHREPLVAQFRTRSVSPAQAFSFFLMNTHTDPGEVPQELEALGNVYLNMRRTFQGEDDMILLGDFNASDRQIARVPQFSGTTCLIHDTTTNTAQTACYDNIVVDLAATAEFTGNWGVLDLQRDLNLSRQQAEQISDHCPVWAEFRASEAQPTPPFASRGFGIR